MTTVIGYDDHVADATLSTTGSTSSPIDNLADGQTWTRTIWDPDVSDTYDLHASFAAPADVDYIGLQGHQLHLATDILVEVETSPGVFVTAANVTNLPSAAPGLLQFNQIYIDAVGVRLTVQAPAALQLGVAYCGLSLALPQSQMAPFSPPVQSRSVRGYPKVSRVGQFMGRQRERVGWQLQLTQTLVPTVWLDAYYVPMMERIEVAGFFALWDDTRPGDCVFAWLDGDQSPPSYSDPINLRFTLNCQALHDDTVAG